MSKGVTKIELVGLEPLLKGLKNLPVDLEPSIIRAVARKPANKILSKIRELASYLLPFSNSKRMFGILPVKDLRQKFVEIGVKGRSLAYIFMFSKGQERKKKSGSETGTIKPVGNLIQMAADEVGQSVVKEMKIDLSQAIARSLRRRRAIQ
jgi:hypothetical protein